MLKDYDKAIRVVRIWLADSDYRLLFVRPLITTFEIDDSFFEVLVQLEAIEAHENQTDTYRAGPRLFEITAKEVISQLKPTAKRILESPTGQAKFGLKRNDIEYIEATARNYTNVHFINGKVELFSRNLGLLCTVLELERTHKSFAVNPNYVRFRDENTIEMRSGKVVAVSRRKIRKKKAL